MIITDIQNVFDSESSPPISKQLTDHLVTTFSFEYLKMTGVIDNMRTNGFSEAFINGYIEGLYTALQEIIKLSNTDMD